MKKYIVLILLIQSLFLNLCLSQKINGEYIDDITLKNAIEQHLEFNAIPNLPADPASMQANIEWLEDKFKKLDFETSRLETSTIPILLVEKVFDPNLSTVLFYFHIDGQAVNPQVWNQKDPFKPILKKYEDDNWNPLNKEVLNEKIDDEWRIFGRSSSDDKGPIIMMLTALKWLDNRAKTPKFNVKIVFDPEEEYGSRAFLTTLDLYKSRYKSDFFIVMDGPAHNSNRPTLTFGCRGIALCTITTYGPKLPQHSGHYGNYAPNPVFRLAKLLTSMKDDEGRVLIEDFYNGIELNDKTRQILNSVPYNVEKFNANLGINNSEKVGKNYQESLQYPSLNVRQIGTSWDKKEAKTVIPEYAIANIDVRLVPETDGKVQLEKIKKHIENQGYFVLDRDPTDDERLQYDKIAKFMAFPMVNSFRTNTESEFGKKIRHQLEKNFGMPPVVIRMMGGTVPIVPLINKLDVPTLIIPMVNMDNNQHNPNENIRIGNIRTGIQICISVLQTNLN